MTQSSPPRDVRQAKLFRNDLGQTVNIPLEFEFSCEHVLISKEGNRLIIEPNLLAILRALSPLGPDDHFPENIDESLLPLRDINL